MNNNLFPDDFFDTDSMSKNSNRKLAKQRLRARKMMPYMKLQIEQIIFISITILVVIVLSFSAGVERGKHVASKEAFKNISVEENNGDALVLPDHIIYDVALAVAPFKELDIDQSDEIKEMEYTEPLIEEVQEEVKIEVEEEIMAPDNFQVVRPTDTQIKILDKKPESSYIVMLVIYKSRDQAGKEIKKLRAAGHDAYYYKNGNWYQVYSEGYATIEEVKKDVGVLKKRYSDCYIRKIKN